MLIERLVLCALGYIAGITLASGHQPWMADVWLLVVAFVGLLVSGFQIHKERRFKPVSTLAMVAATMIFVVPLGIWRAATFNNVQDAALRAYLDSLESGDIIILRGQIAAEPALTTMTRGRLDVRVNAVKKRGASDWTNLRPSRARINLYMPDDPEAKAVFVDAMAADAYGYTVELNVQHRPPAPPANPGQFNYSEFLSANGIDALFSIRHRPPRPYGLTIVERSKGNAAMELALKAKQHFLDTYQRTVRSPGSRLVAATTLGSRQLLSEVNYRGRLVPDLFRHAGVGHVLAVSGLHVSIISLLIFALFRLCGVPPKWFVPALILILFLFTLLSGGRPSSVRAAIMNSIIMIAFVYLRCNLRRATAAGLSFSSILILAHHPLILYTPGFLLSFGAVLSLVMLVGPIDRFMFQLRGWALLLTSAVGLGYLLLACQAWDLFLTTWTMISMPGAIGVASLVGNALNHRFPVGWGWGLDKVPDVLRMFLSAQLAIQFGMMVPMSAWFFGQFPVGGMFVNLIAIPLVGVLVQLGVLTGLMAAVPLIGVYAARAFGAATSYTADAFLLMAHYGAELFPFPAVPRPTLTWMVAYYVVLLAVVLGEPKAVPWLQGKLYGIAKQQKPNFLRVPVVVVAGLLSAAALLNTTNQSPTIERVDVFHSNAYPLVATTLNSGKAVVVNGGDKYSGGQVLFDSLRHHGAYIVDAMFVSSAEPKAGHDGANALLTKAQVTRCFVPVVSSPDNFLESLGDRYVLREAKKGRDWARAYQTSFASLTTTAAKQGVTLEELPYGSAFDWGPQLSVTTLPKPDWQPRKYESAVWSRIVTLNTAGFHWTVLTDSTDRVLRKLAEKGQSFKTDVLVISDITYGNRRYYRYLVNEALKQCQPRVVIVTVDKWARLENPLFSSAEALDEPPIVLRTDKNGAISATFSDQGMTLTAYQSDQQWVLPRLDAQTSTTE